MLATSHDKNTSSSHSTVGLADAPQVLRADLQHGAALQAHPVQRLIAEVTQIAHDAFHHVAIARIRRIATDRDLLGSHGHADLSPRAELLFAKHG